MTIHTTVFVHPTAEVSPQATIGEGTKIWHHCQVRERAVIGCCCILSKGVYVDLDVYIGNNVKVQNGASIYHGVTIEDGVFIGPHACLTNDKVPRAIAPDGHLKRDADWEVGRILIKYGASIGAGGGVFLNVKMNQRIIEQGLVEEFHVFPAAGDCGLGLGAALHVAAIAEKGAESHHFY